MVRVLTHIYKTYPLSQGAANPEAVRLAASLLSSGLEASCGCAHLQ